MSYMEAHDLTNSTPSYSLFGLGLSKHNSSDIEIDHCPLDLYVIGNEGHAYRPSLVIVLDARTRIIVGCTVTFS